MAQGKMMGRVFRKAAIGVAALAIVCAMVPMAMATPTATDANAADDVYFTVEWTATDGTACSAEVDATALADNVTYGTVYSKGSYQVIGTNNSVAVGDLIKDASYTVGTGRDAKTYYASEVWDEDATLTVCTTDALDGYGDYSYSTIMDELPFYGASTSSSIIPGEPESYYAARIALSYVSTSMNGTAWDTLYSIDFSKATVDNRLIFGYSDLGTAGSLFPKEVCGFIIK